MPIAPDAPLFSIADVLDRLNRVTAPRRNKKGMLVPRWNRWNVTRLLQKRHVQLSQGGKRGKFYLTLHALRTAWPDLWESVLDAEALRDIAA
jgi:hypothetical protein